jgi:hypothetical protein
MRHGARWLCGVGTTPSAGRPAWCRSAEAERLEAERLAVVALWADAEPASGRALASLPELTRFTTA